MAQVPDFDAALPGAQPRSTRYRAADGLPYMFFGVFLLIWGVVMIRSASYRPVERPLAAGWVHFLVPADWRPVLGFWAVWLPLIASPKIIEWVRRRFVYPRTGYVAIASGVRKLEFGHFLIAVPVFVFALGAPYLGSPVASQYGLWIVAASLLVSFAGVLRCQGFRGSEFLYIAFPAAAFVLWKYFATSKHLIPRHSFTALFALQGIAFVAIGLIHLFLYIRRYPRTQGNA